MRVLGHLGGLPRIKLHFQITNLLKQNRVLVLVLMTHPLFLLQALIQVPDLIFLVLKFVHEASDFFWVVILINHLIQCPPLKRLNLLVRANVLPQPLVFFHKFV